MILLDLHAPIKIGDAGKKEKADQIGSSDGAYERIETLTNLQKTKCLVKART
jgi:hypothetical protein